MPDERLILIRSLRQQLEALGRAGLDRIPAPTLPDRPAPMPRRETARPEPTPAATPVTERPPAPTPAPSKPARPEPTATPPVSLPASLFGEESLDAPTLPPEQRQGALDVLAAEVATCEKCPQLAASRTQTVFGDGNPNARLMFIGEAPGADEDRLGLPFVGKAGQLLNDMITKGMGLRREDVYIANILKSRPPGNRDPQPDEVAHCLPYLERQIEIIRPEFLCLLGRVAGQNILKTALPMGRLRGKWHRYKGIPTIVTYHPAALLRNAGWKKDAWADLQMLMNAMGLKIPERKKGGGAST